MTSSTNDASRWSRRSFLTNTAASTMTVTLLDRARGESLPQPDIPPDPDALLNVKLRVNGRDHRLAIDGRTTLLDALREHAGLTGTKKGCDHGQCGACTVLMDNRRVLSCLSFAAMSEGRDVTTIEGLAKPDGTLHPMQQAFIDHDAFQCGYCTPGQIMSAVACVHEGHAENDVQIRDSRIALGGVSALPLRAREAEQKLKGRKLDDVALNEAAETAFAQAQPREHNAFKVQLGKLTLIRALRQAATMEL
jgi:xanthine dehydrogenase YagT iron-sulfur-binding subunit